MVAIKLHVCYYHCDIIYTEYQAGDWARTMTQAHFVQLVEKYQYSSQ